MQGLKVQCPNCKRKDFVTTDKYDPNKTPNGSMVKCLLGYQIDWLCNSGTVVSEMTCPECLAPLVVGNVLNVVMPAREAGELFKKAEFEQREQSPLPGSAPEAEVQGKDSPPDTETPFICDICGKECKSQFGLTGHKNRSHKAVQR